MFIDDKKRALSRILIGGGLGVLGCLLLGWLSQPGALFGASLTWDFTFCYNSNVPEALGAALGILLWFLFGAEAGVATLPFADEGGAVVLRSLAHFGVMAATMWGWVMLNFTYEPLPGLVLTFLLPFTLVYILVWLGRWVGWYAEVGEIRSRLGLAPGPSFLKWRETLPHMAYAMVLCLAVPLALRAADAVDGPLLSIFYAGVLLPVGAFITGSSLGKRRGFCPLYPLMCGVGILMFIPMARLFSNMDDRAMVPTAFVSALLGNLLGVARRRRRDRMAARPAGEGRGV